MLRRTTAKVLQTLETSFKDIWTPRKMKEKVEKEYENALEGVEEELDFCNADEEKFGYEEEQQFYEEGT